MSEAKKRKVHGPDYKLGLKRSKGRRRSTSGNIKNNSKTGAASSSCMSDKMYSLN